MTDTTVTPDADADAVALQVPSRFHMYAQMRKGLRTFMAETILAWGRLDCDDDHAVKNCLDLLTSLLDACAVHLDKEGRYVHPALEAACPGASGRIENEHLHDLHHLASIARPAGDRTARAADECASHCSSGSVCRHRRHGAHASFGPQRDDSWRARRTRRQRTGFLSIWHSDFARRSLATVTAPL